MIETKTDEVKNEDSSIISKEAKKKRLSIHKIVDIYVIPFFQLLHGEPNMEDTIHLTILERRQRNAIYSLLNFFEFTCQQYLEDKIDKDAFKLFYNNKALKNVLGEFKNMINDGTYPYTKNVLDEWESDDGG